MSSPSEAPALRSASEPRWSLLVAILGSTMAFLDGTVVNVALPVMMQKLSASVAEIEWVVEAYALLLAALVLVGGALGDRFGRRRVFVAGVVVFSASSVACGLSPGVLFLVGARAAQGVGAALLVPGSLALVGAAYGEKERPGAIGTWSAATSIAAALGPLAGGWAVVHMSWRAIFFFNVPLGAAVALIATLKVNETRNPDAAQKTDVAGAALVTIALGAIVWSLLEAPKLGGLTSPIALGALLGGLALLFVFVLVEAHVTGPMVPMSLFRSPTFAGTNLVTLLLYAALGAFMFFLPFDLIELEHYSPAEAGAALLPCIVLISGMSHWAGRLVPKFGARLPLVVGPAVTAGAFALLAVPAVGGSYWTTFFPGIVLLGLGMGVTVAPLTAAVMGSVDAKHAGVASGINNAVSRAASLLAIAALGVVLVVRFDAVLDGGLPSLGLSEGARRAVEHQRSMLAAAELPPGLDAVSARALRALLDEAFVAGFRSLMVACAALAALAALAAFATIGRDETPR